MSTGSLSGGVCYESSTLAADAYFSGLPVISRFDAVNNYSLVESYSFSAGVWHRVTTASTPWWSAPFASDVVVPPAFVPCYAPSEAFADGVAIGWAFVGVLTTAFFVMMIKKALS